MKRSSLCYLAIHGQMRDGSKMPSCQGALRRCHIIPKQTLRRTDSFRRGAFGLWHPAVWVFACGGLGYGNAGHHGMFDHTRSLTLPRSAISAELERFADVYGLSWWLDREYGEQEVAA